MSENKCQFDIGDAVVVSDRTRSKIPTADKMVQQFFDHLLRFEPLTIADVTQGGTIPRVKLKGFGNIRFPATLFSPLIREVVKGAEIEDLL